MKSARLTIFLVLFNDRQHIPRLVESLKKQSCQDFQVWALDNNSPDDSVIVLNELYPSAEIFRSEENLGYAGGNNLLFNLLIKKGSSDYVAVLNTDIELENNFVDFSLSFLEVHQDFSGFAPLVYYGKEDHRTSQIQCLGINANFIKAQAILHIPVEIPTSEIVVDGLPGCSFVFRTSDIPDKILFNSEGFMYGEELDLAYRCYQKGIKLAASTGTCVWHHHDWSPKNTKGIRFQYYYMMRNRILFYFRYRKIFSFLFFLVRELFLYPLRYRWLNRLAGSKLVYYYYLGIRDGLLKKKGRVGYEFE
ncbi:MAG: glycosyltransferase family 2 protein [Saprospiraceae bacterium]|nr:glycosyltransferase family 2 protein [Saprospiraceae bacterium]